MSETPVAQPAPVDEDWVRPTPPPEDLRKDGIAAVLMLLGMSLSCYLYGVLNLYEVAINVPVTAAWAVVMTLPLAWRRRYPITVAMIISAGFIASAFLDIQEFLFGNISLFAAIYSVGAWSKNRLYALISRVIITAIMLLWIVLTMVWTSAYESGDGIFLTEGSTISARVAMMGVNLVINLLYFAGAYWFGDSMYRAAKARALIEAQAAALAEQRRTATQQAVTLERLRIARELHDVVAHHVSAMGIQASAARRWLEAGKDPAKALDHLEAVESSARGAIDELRLLLRTLRDDSSDQDQPSTIGVEQLPNLVAESERAGSPAVYQVVGARYHLPATVEQTLYRVAQEALSNVRRHAPGSTADVRLRYLTDAVELEVSNGGAQRSEPVIAGTGLGLTGMTERVSALGGTVQAGPRRDGGWLLRVRIPATMPTPASTRATPRAKKARR